MIQITLPQTSPVDTANSYELYLAISSTTLIVFSKEEKPLEWIRSGDDNDALLCSFEDEEHFLDCILIVSALIDRGLNPLKSNKINFHH